MLKKADGEYEVHWDDLIAVARAPAFHRTDAARRMDDARYDIKWRTPRLKLYRTEADDAERMRGAGGGNDRHSADGRLFRRHGSPARLDMAAHLAASKD